MKDKSFLVMAATGLAFGTNPDTDGYNTNFNSMRSPGDVKYRKKRKKLNRISKHSRQINW